MAIEFIELTKYTDDKSIFVNMALVQTFCRSYASCTAIMFAEEETLSVTETPEQIQSKMKELQGEKA